MTLTATLLATIAAANPLADWPKGCEPETIGRRVTEQFLSADPERYAPKGFDGKFGNGTAVHYAMVSLWVNAIDFAVLSGNAELESRLLKRFDPYYPGGTLADHISKPKHVDFYIFGALPYTVYRRTGDRRALEMGNFYADGQWAMPHVDDHERTFTPWLLKTAKLHNLDYASELKWWKAGYTPQTRLWIDDMYMITVLQTRAYAATGDRKYLDRTAYEMCLYIDRLQLKEGPAAGLFYHEPSVPFVWARGAGWMAAGMAIVLSYMPEDHPHYAKIMDGCRKMMSALLKYQRKDGLWGQVVTDSEMWSETSGSAMYAYAFIEGVRHGWLDGRYAEAARTAYLALCARLDEYANLAGVCEGTGARNDRAWYENRRRINGDPHGQAPMLWICNALLSR